MSTVVPASTFQERLADQRRKLEQRKSFEISVPSYENLWARYKILGYEEVRNMGLRNEEEASTIAEGEQNTAADVLSEACIELLELKGYDGENKPVFQSLGYRWTAKAALDLFEVQLPEGTLPRTVLKAIFPYPHDTLMMAHFNSYMMEADIGLGEIEKAMLGESQASSERT